MRLFFALHDLPVKIQAEETGFGSGEALAKSRKLLDQDRVHLVTGALNPDVVPFLRGLFVERRKILFACSSGENAIRPGIHSPYIFHNTLGLYPASRAFGAWAVRNLGRQAFVASSVYDSGYDFLSAFRQAFEVAGGEVLQVFVSHTGHPSAGLEALLAAAGQANPDFVYAQYCGSEAVEFVRAFAASELAGKVPLAGSGFLVEEPALAHQGSAALGISSAMSWASSLESVENSVFLSAFRRAAGRPADAFAALGYDTAYLLAAAVHAAGGDPGRTARLVDALEHGCITGPRGPVAMDPGTHQAAVPVFLRKVIRRGSAAENEVLSELPPAAPLAAGHDSSGLRSGWLNAYLSA